MKIVFINGPPGSGKDTAANAIYGRMKNARTYKMAQPIIEAVRGAFRISNVDWKGLMSPEFKQSPSDKFFGRTPRETMISFSEDWIKPFFGKDTFGHLAVRELMTSKMDLCAISDSGFREECLPVVQQFGRQNCLVIQLKRDGCTFKGDSRSYLDLSDAGVPLVQVDNYMELEWFELFIVTKVQKHFGIT